MMDAEARLLSLANALLQGGNEVDAIASLSGVTNPAIFSTLVRALLLKASQQ